MKITGINKNSFLLNSQNSIISAALVVSGMYAVSAILGLFRTRLLAHYFGDSAELAVFYTADRIPSFIYSVLVVGTLSAVFIPIFTNAYSKSKVEAWNFASGVIFYGTIVFAVLAGFAFIFAPQLITALSVGKFTTEEIKLGAQLMRIMLIGQLLLVMSSFLSSILQSFKFFFVSALAPVMYNLGMLLGTIFLNGNYGIYAPAISVILGGFMHLAIQIPMFVSTIDFRFYKHFKRDTKSFKELAKMFPPRVFGAFVSQISPTVNNSLAVLVSTSSVVYLRNAIQLQSFPVFLFGASMAQAALPSLSLESDPDKREQFKQTFLTTFHQMMFFVLPASVLLLILRVPAVRFAVGTPNYSWDATLKTAMALGFFSISIFSQSSAFLMNRAFYALKDTLTPVLISLFTISVSTAISLFMVTQMHYEVWAVAFAFSVGSILDLIIMMFFLSRKVGGFDSKALLMPFFKISMAAIFMGFSLYLPIKLLDIRYVDTSRTVNLFGLTLFATLAGGISYLIFTKLFKVEEIQLLYKLIKRFNVKTVTAEQTAGVSEETVSE